MKAGRWWHGIAGLSLVLVGCGSDGQNVEAGPGAALYETSCASCHGSGLEGSSDGPPLLSIVYEPNHHPDDAIRAAIARGAPQHHWDFGDMKPIEGLSGNDVELIIAHIRNEQERRGYIG